VAYSACRGDRRFLVVDGDEQPPHDAVMEGSPAFSPDGRRVAYVARDGQAQRLIFDGVESSRTFNAVVTIGGGGLFFDGPDRLRYIGPMGTVLLLVEATLT
jgi:hypothetical protein